MLSNIKVNSILTKYLLGPRDLGSQVLNPSDLCSEEPAGLYPFYPKKATSDTKKSRQLPLLDRKALFPGILKDNTYLKSWCLLNKRTIDTSSI